MRRFLVENRSASGEAAQNARAIIVIQAAKKGALPEAEARLAEYALNQPQIADDRYVLENLLVSRYFKNRDYEHALPHAQELWKAAGLVAKKRGSSARDAMLNEAATVLSEADLKLQKKADAIAVVQTLREMALRLPSGNLYKLSMLRLLQIDPTTARAGSAAGFLGALVRTVPRDISSSAKMARKLQGQGTGYSGCDKFFWPR